MHIEPAAVPGSEPLLPAAPRAGLAEEVPIARPSLPPEDELFEELRRVLRSGQLTNGRLVAELEERAAAFLGVPECVALSSCTAGLMLAERCLGLRGRVIVPSFTFFATAHSLLWNNVEPVLADCDPGTFQIDPEKVERAVKPGVSAILAVHLFGSVAPVRELEEIARRKGLKLIFDAAHAFGAQVDGRPAAVWGDASVFSLSPTKTLVAGEGGLAATGDPELAARLRRARNYGKGSGYDCEVLGLNARMTELQAALALHGLPHVEAGIAHRNRVAAVYESRLAGVPGLRLQKIPPEVRSARKDFAVLVDAERFGLSRSELEEALRRAGVETRRYFDPPLHRQSLYRGFYRPGEDALEVAGQLSRQVLCLPIHAGLPLAVAERVADRIASAARERKQASSPASHAVRAKQGRLKNGPAKPIELLAVPAVSSTT